MDPRTSIFATIYLTKYKYVKKTTIDIYYCLFPERHGRISQTVRLS